ncbi:hypothetical protein CLIB1423_06S00892 [[Candida] railenensis]|uniref:Alpha/beta hydrolase fold-3 domain-containing protein n=1 Tax=[Candida] railenensis TaxID=45579 RepID=A0A9P0VXN7_9ASCO|nr:hypothetical protein CLIB1423_06S00892 [[Candida] railenensis]
MSLKLTIYRSATDISPPDTKILALMSNDFIINTVMNFHYKRIVSELPSFGKKYDEKSYWLVKQPNRKSSDPIIIYLHGGGYFLQSQPEQFESTLSMYKLLKPETQKKLSILFLDYSLACYDYCGLPTQLNELHRTYHKLTVQEGNSNIILMGDSAGGNLSIGYTQYLKTLIKEKRLSEAQAVFPSNMILVSPWCKIEPTPDQFQPGRSYYDNNDYDMIRYRSLMVEGGKKYLISSQNIDALTASPNSKLPHSPKDWGDVPTYTREKSNIFVILGEDEVFRDDILIWAEYALGCPLYSENKYGNSGGVYDPKIHEFVRKGSPGKCAVQLYVEPLGVHDSFFFFENHLLKKIQSAEGNPSGPQVRLSQLKDSEFFATKRIVKFLDAIL